MAERIAFDVNGVLRTIEVTPQTPLLYVLRNELGLSNPHFGCGLAQCGACTVHLDGWIMTAAALLRDTPHPSEQQIRDGLSGLKCRCGTHMAILRAVRRAAQGA